MKKVFASLLATAWGMICCSPSAVLADVRLPAVLGNHMVLQRDQPIAIWGWADPGEEVTVTFVGSSKKATADDQGNWKVTLPAKGVNVESQPLVITGKNTITLTDILVGDVWVGSGQSNMEWPLQATKDAQAAIAAATHPTIRLFHIPKLEKPAPADDVVASWTECKPETVPNFSAVLYYYGLKLNHELNIPIGLINSSWGGSAIEPWIVEGEKSGGMYNGMIAPITPFAIRGAIWYQGETNAMQKNGMAYYDKMNSLITGWRKAWRQDIPFYFVQIAPWEGSYPPGELPALWEAQVASLKIPGTGMAVTTDLVDNIKDIHPQNKLDVGDRLALWALAKNYCKKGLVYSGPLYKSMKVEGKKIRLEFAHATKGLKSRDGKPLTEFEIAGEDGQFVKADATIDGKTVVVSSEKVAEPTQVRLGWHSLGMPNLVNSADLPASPFQTNNWQGGLGE